MNRKLLILPALALTLGACGPAEDTEPYEPPPVYPTGDTVDDYIDPLAFGTVIAAEMRLTARFGWDADLEEILAPVSIDGDMNSPGAAEIYVTLYADGWADASDEDQAKMICHVGVELDGLTQMETLDGGRYWGVEVTFNADMMHDTCIDAGFDPAQFLEEDPQLQYGDQNWIIQLGGELEQSTADWITDVWGDNDDFDINHYAGASLTSDSFGPDYEDNWFLGWALDPYTLDVSSEDRMLNSQFDAGDTLATGYYLFDQNIFWNVGPVE